MGHKSTASGSSVVNFRSMLRDRQRALEALPPPRASHWVARQKKAVVEAVNSGMLPLTEAMRRYELSLEEFMTWQQAYAPQAAPQLAPRTPPQAAVPERPERVLEAVA